MSDLPPPLATIPSPALANVLARVKELSKTNPMPSIPPCFHVRRNRSSPAKIPPLTSKWNLVSPSPINSKYLLVKIHLL
ncbi:hypothetical protein PanWU01x14_201060 [Parasponia andersonii]|uniref:Uncharacterized protein n=1 Tax=Parasponia andersonii TaxID=3476 RepID=A0A2P5BXN7_PARAD|nr:hypothetical protein PanWU01x14_201060 [Parasponia andersonii]